jgi:hypothetical protein
MKAPHVYRCAYPTPRAKMKCGSLGVGGTKPPLFRSARYPGTAPWYLSTLTHEAVARSRTCLSRAEGKCETWQSRCWRRGSKQNNNKKEFPNTNTSRANVKRGSLGVGDVDQNKTITKREIRTCTCMFSFPLPINWSTLQEPSL